MDADKLRRLCEIDTAKKTLKAQEKTLNDERRIVEAELMEEFINDGINSVKTNGRTVYLQTARRARATDAQAAVLILLASGMEGCVSVNAASLSARVREFDTVEEFFGANPDLVELVKVEEMTSIRTRKA